MDLALQQLRSFVTVAEELHFGRAALRLGLSQPQVSRHVRALEDRLGVVLFARTGRRTSLSDAGAALLDDAYETLRSAERLQMRAGIVARRSAGHVAVGFVWSTLVGCLPTLVAAASERSPQIELSTSQLRFVEIIPALRRGDIDLVICRPMHEPTELIELTLTAEPSLLAIPEGHSFAARSSVALAQLEGVPQIALQRELAPAAYDAVIAAAWARGVRPLIVQHARTPSETLALVSAGIGVYRLPASAAPAHPGVIYRELDDAPTRLVLMRRPEPPEPAVAEITELALALFADAPDASNDSATDLELSIARA